jgi:hypothetical protein
VLPCSKVFASKFKITTTLKRCAVFGTTALERCHAIKRSVKAIGKNVVVGRVAGPAGEMRAIRSSIFPHVCVLEGRFRPMPRFVTAVEVIDSALVALYGP